MQLSIALGLIRWELHPFCCCCLSPLPHFQALGSCTRVWQLETASALYLFLPVPPDPCLAAVQAHLEAAQRWVISPPVGSCACTTAGESGTKRSSGNAGTAASCVFPAQLFAAQLQQRQNLLAPWDKSSSSGWILPLDSVLPNLAITDYSNQKWEMFIKCIPI